MVAIMFCSLHLYVAPCFIFTLFISSVSTDTRKRKGDPCLTLDSKDGKCVPPEYCQILSTKPSIRISVCEFNLICCENSGPFNGNYLKTNTLQDYSICGIVKEQARIWGGEVAEIGEFPWVAAIEYIEKINNRKAGVRCVGSLINDEFVLTTAVCVTDVEFIASKVRLGESNLSTDPDCEEFVANKLCADPVEIILIKEIIAHPFHSRIAKNNDIALIRLEHNIEFTEYIRPICLSSLDWPPLKVGTTSIVAGWGRTGNDTDTTSDVLMKVEVSIASQDECNRAFDQQRPLPLNPRHLCVQGVFGQGSCRGDSGAPLMRIYEDREDQTNGIKLLKWYQDGIASSGRFRCGNKENPVIYTKVAEYFDWIASVILEYGTQ